MTDIPFAKMLEYGIRELIDGKAVNAVLCGGLEDNTTLTATANTNAEDLAVIAWHLLSTAMMKVVLANIDMVKDALDGLECEDNEPEGGYEVGCKE